MPEEKMWHNFKIFYRDDRGILQEIEHSYLMEDTSFYAPEEFYAIFGKGLVGAGEWIPPGAIVRVEFLGRE